MSDNYYKKLSEDRKKLQEQGLIPDWYTTGGYQLFASKYEYDTNGRSVRGQFERIARTAASYLNGTKYEKEAEGKFFNLLWKGWLSPSTPVLSNMGTDKGMSVSCSGTYIEDSIDGFFSNRHENAMLTKHGFGTSSYLGNIRHRGSPISAGGTATGVLPVLKGHIQDSREVSQGGQRRGAWAGYIEIDHNDFDEIADFILAEPDDANIGWNITDKFMEKMQDGDEESIRRYQKALKLKMITGKGYFCFVDKINAKRPKAYTENGLEVKASNLCVTGDTKIVVTYGINGTEKEITIDKFVTEYDYSKTLAYVQGDQDGTLVQALVTNAALTGYTHETYEIVGEWGDNVSCTADHQIFTTNRGYVKAKDLCLDDMLMTYRGKCSIDSIRKVHTENKIPVYDLTVPRTKNFYANGILVHNCNEITLFSDEDHSFSCVLSSMNASRYYEWKNTDAVYWATIFLDCVASDLIAKADGIKGLEKVRRFTEKGRALGLGVAGLHTLFQIKMLPFESLEAHMLSQELQKHIWEESLRASQDMATELGEPEWCKGFGLRNTHRIAIAPTKSTALLMGGISEGINPDPAFVYTQLTGAGNIDRMNPQLIALMKSKGVYNKKTIAEVTDKQGSVQHVDWLTNHEKDVFKTAFEINQKVVLRLASARARYIDQWQSLNLFFDANEDEAWISEVHQEAFLDRNILGLYYIYSKAGVQASKSDCEACQ